MSLIVAPAALFSSSSASAQVDGDLLVVVVHILTTPAGPLESVMSTSYEWALIMLKIANQLARRTILHSQLRILAA